MLSDNETDKITTEEADRSLQIESWKLSKLKIKSIYNTGCNNRDASNEVSEYVCSHFYDFFNIDTWTFVTQTDFITMIREAFPKSMSNTFDSETYKIIHTGYSNKVKAMVKKLTIREKVERDRIYYKKRTTKIEKDDNGNEIKVVKEPGDLRVIRYKYIDTKKSKTLTYLAKYGRNSTYEWLKEQLSTNKELNKSQRKNYEMYISVCDEFGFDVLLAEALEHRKMILEKYLNPCEFESTTLHIDSRIRKTFIRNKKKGSKVKYFAELAIPYKDENGILHEHMFIPLKWNEKYHGDLLRFNSSGDNNHIYMVMCIDKYKKCVDMHICEKQEVSHREPTENDKYCSFDLNTNGKKIEGSLNISIDHTGDDKIVAELAKLKKQLQEGQAREKELAKKQNRKYVPSNALSNRKRHKAKRLSDIMKSHNNSDAAVAVKEAKEKGSNHIIMEDLNGKFSKSKAKDVENDQNFNDKTSSMQLSSIKDAVLGICQKQHMSMTLVQPEYTSQRCPVCGSISEENRKSQENFKCIDCGYTINADKNATDNMIHRVVSKKLCEKLLKRSADGYVPNTRVRHDQLLEIIETDCCRTLPKYCYSKIAMTKKENNENFNDS